MLYNAAMLEYSKFIFILLTTIGMAPILLGLNELVMYGVI